VVLPGSLLKQQSVEALFGARQRLLLAEKLKEGGNDNVARNGPETVQATVNARQSHWLFDNAANTAAARVAETLQDKGTPPASGTTLNAAQVLTATNKGDAKSASGTLPSSPVQTAQAIPPGDAAQRQALDGRQPNGGNSRDQMLAGNRSQRQVADASAASSSDRASFDVPDAPPTAQGATQQVRTGIVKALADLDPGSRAPSTSQLTPDRPPVANQVLRSIDITLSPPDLGTVRLKLSLKSNALDIDAEASKASTAKLLDSDRKSLEQSLRDAGYDVKSMKIADASASNSANMNSSSNGNGQSFQDGSQARGNFSGRQDGNMGRRDGAMPDQSQQQQPRGDGRKGAPAPDVAGRRQSDAIYI
jgi:flagellar hook-length control protein FliK